MKCWLCNEEATRTNKKERIDIGGAFVITESEISNKSRCYCEKCFNEWNSLLKFESEEYVRLKKKIMFENAISNIEKQNVDIYKLQPAIKLVEERVISNPDDFDSSYEIIAAIVLINCGCKFKMQSKVGRYQVDIMIPDKKIIVEIDGERHKNRKSFDSERDENIKNILGQEWKILRIETEYLDKKALKLPKAINELAKYKTTRRVNWREI